MKNHKEAKSSKPLYVNTVEKSDIFAMYCNWAHLMTLKRLSVGIQITFFNIPTVLYMKKHTKQRNQMYFGQL